VKALIDRYRPLVARLKASSQLRVVDTHVHAADVMNVVGLASYTRRPDGQRWTVDGAAAVQPRLDRADLMARLRYSRLRRRLEAVAFTRLPRMVCSTIRGGFAEIGLPRLKRELAASGVDAVVLLTLPPNSSIDAVHPIYGSPPEVIYLGSVDVHGIAADDVPATLARQQREHGIVGIKLHPNLQGFYPLPEDNPEPVAHALHRVYEAAGKLGLYVLLHGGRSHLIPATLQAAGHPRDRARPDCAVLERYCDAAGRSQLLDRYRCRFVLAHLASAGVRPSWRRLADMAARYPHLSLDTSGMWSGTIARAVELLGASRLLFGSDGLYNLLLLELVACVKGVERGSTRDRFEENAMQVLGANFARLVARSAIGPAVRP
jgi:predicted TIM-barrel fold metal-dependent hydrolase